MQGDQKVSVHLTITVKSTGAQTLFDHPILQSTEFIYLPFGDGPSCPVGTSHAAG